MGIIEKAIEESRQRQKDADDIRRSKKPPQCNYKARNNAEHRFRDALEVAVKSLANNGLNCEGRRHDCPSCNSDSVREDLNEIERILEGK